MYSFDSIHSQNRFRAVDGRVKIPLLIASCLVTQYLPPSLLAPWLVLITVPFTVREMRSDRALALLRGGVFFTIFWFIVTTGSDWLGGAPAANAALVALPMAARLLALAGLGIAFTGLSSPMETGRALSWYSRPLLGKNAWKPALVIALVSWFLPITLQLAGQVDSSLKARGVRLSWWRRAYVTVGTSLRILMGNSDQLAIGIASRLLDNERAWK